MVNVGVIGLGSMGTTHLDVYSKMNNVKVVAIADSDPDRLAGKTKAEGNVPGQAQGSFNSDTAKRYPEGMLLIADPQVQVVDICMHTHQHFEYAKKALLAGKHVLLEKPICRSVAEARELVELSEKIAPHFMVAQCMRFWPGWTWVKEAVASKKYGKVLAAHFRRVGSAPGGPFYTNGALCGGAIMDLHIHDTDFVNFVFGVPASVSSFGYAKQTGAIDHVFTHYHYDDVPLVVAEGGWAMAPGFGFKMQFTINFENATAVYDLANSSALTLCTPENNAQPVTLIPGMGYEHEIAYFIDGIIKGVKPKTSTGRTSLDSLRIVDAENESIATGRRATVK